MRKTRSEIMRAKRERKKKRIHIALFLYDCVDVKCVSFTYCCCDHMNISIAATHTMIIIIRNIGEKVHNGRAMAVDIYWRERKYIKKFLVESWEKN